MIWTGSNEIMNLLIQHEYFQELLAHGPAGRDVEPDALNPEPDPPRPTASGCNACGQTARSATAAGAARSGSTTLRTARSAC